MYDELESMDCRKEAKRMTPRECSRRIRLLGSLLPVPLVVLSFCHTATVAIAEPFYLEHPAFPKSAFQLGDISAELEPVLRTSADHKWDSVDVLNPSVVQWRGQYWNFYSGFDGETWRTGVATSADGKIWAKSDHNPVLGPSERSWDRQLIAANGSAIAIRDRLHYYYQGKTKEKVLEIGLATSADGIVFEESAEPVLIPGPSGAWDESAVADPYVIEYHGSYYMYFLGMNQAGVQRLGVAKSDDGMKWVKHPGNPILDIGAAGTFDSLGVGEPSVVNIGGTFIMLYTGRNDLEQRSIGVALSLDGINWRRQSSQQLPIPRAAWSSEVLCDPTMMLTDDGKLIRVWYGGGNVRSPAEKLNGQVGYFEMSIPAWAYSGFDAKGDWTSSPTPSTTVLKGSYPIQPDGTCWIGPTASMVLKPPFEHGIQISGYLPVSAHRSSNAGLHDLAVQIFLDGTKVAEVREAEDKAFGITAVVPLELRNKVLELQIRVSDDLNMAKAGTGEDKRDLGVIITRIKAVE